MPPPPNNAKEPLEKTGIMHQQALTPPSPQETFNKDQRDERRFLQRCPKESLYQKFSNYLRLRIKFRLKKLIKLDFRQCRQYIGNNQILIQTELGFPLIILGSDVSLSTALLIDNTWEPQGTSKKGDMRDQEEKVGIEIGE